MSSQLPPVSPPIDYYNNGPGMVGSTLVLAFLATIAVILRFWARRLTKVPLGLDDYLVLAALVLHHAQAAAGFATVFGGGVGRDFRLVLAEGPDTTVVLFKALLAADVLYGFSSPLVKLAVLVFIRRIFPTRTIKIGTIVLASLSIGWAIAVLIVNLLQCRPLRAFWQLELQALPETQCLDFILYFVGNSIANTVIDFCTLVLPIHEILKLQISKAKKIGVCGIFLLGGIAFAASLLRTISTAILLGQELTNFTKQFVVPAVASVVEIYVAIVGACIPLLIPVYYRLRYGTGFNNTAGFSPKLAMVKEAGNTPETGMTKGGLGSFEQLRDDIITSNRRISISAWPTHESGHSHDNSIEFEGITVQKQIEWLETKPAP
ncbi:hypothetical protein EKO27_g3116 [Xylaria grammica]|uniref:Rhodopsin domain-containing protein n=1 Tax=Xylaria grammica TaxID=363999 RepID=A0A439DC49_9PEZI|nr:hypothetical protein EKO27_g3116 [Xylaria grammica]